MAAIVECEQISKTFVMRENRQYLLKDRARRCSARTFARAGRRSGRCAT